MRYPTDRQDASHDPLPALRQRLVEEFGGVVPDETIDRIAEQTLSELHGARIPDYVPMFAWRRARRRLSRLS